MDKILSNKESENKTKYYFNQSYFENLLLRINDLLVADFSPIRKIIEIYATSIDYKGSSFDLIKIRDSLYQKITGKTVRELKEEKGVEGSVFELLEDGEKEASKKISQDILSLAIKKAKSKIPMTMED